MELIVYVTCEDRQMKWLLSVMMHFTKAIFFVLSADDKKHVQCFVLFLT